MSPRGRAVRRWGALIAAVAVDYGGVLVDPPSAAANLARLARELERTPAELREGVYGPGRARWNLAKTGRLAEARLWEEAGRALRLPSARIAWLRAGLFEAVRVRAPLLECLRGLRGRYRLALVSNALPSFTATWRGLGFEALFEVMINSAEVGSAKPEPAIYARALAALGLGASQCVFADDQAENVRAAERLGFAGVHCPDPARAVAALRAVLARDGRRR